MVQILMASLLPERQELWGATLGRAHSKDIQNQAGSSTYGFVVLDFSSIVAISPSYLKQVLPDFLDPADGSRIFPVVSNLVDDVREDLEVYLRQKRWILREVDLSGGGLVTSGFVGKLDSTVRGTLEALEKQEEATASELYEKHQGLGINQTAWNNRLLNLVDLRLADRSKTGRFWVYRPSTALASNG